MACEPRGQATSESAKRVSRPVLLRHDCALKANYGVRDQHGGRGARHARERPLLSHELRASHSVSRTDQPLQPPADHDPLRHANKPPPTLIPPPPPPTTPNFL